MLMLLFTLIGENLSWSLDFPILFTFRKCSKKTYEVFQFWRKWLGCHLTANQLWIFTSTTTAVVGHTIRRPQNIPARLVKEQYVSPNNSPRFTGRLPPKIVITLNGDLISATNSKIPNTDHNYCIKSELALKYVGDLRNIEATASNRDYWKSIAKRKS